MLIFRRQPRGFTNADLRALLADDPGRPPGTITPGQATYDLRRLKEHGFIRRIPHSPATTSPTSGWPRPCSSPAHMTVSAESSRAIKTLATIGSRLSILADAPRCAANIAWMSYLKCPFLHEPL
jgi:hypothetical protein